MRNKVELFRKDKTLFAKVVKVRRRRRRSTKLTFKKNCQSCLFCNWRREKWEGSDSNGQKKTLIVTINWLIGFRPRRCSVDPAVYIPTLRTPMSEWKTVKTFWDFAAVKSNLLPQNISTCTTTNAKIEERPEMLCDPVATICTIFSINFYYSFKFV